MKFRNNFLGSLSNLASFWTSDTPSLAFAAINLFSAILYWIIITLDHIDDTNISFVRIIILSTASLVNTMVVFIIIAVIFRHYNYLSIWSSYLLCFVIYLLLFLLLQLLLLSVLLFWQIYFYRLYSSYHQY